MGEGGQGGEGGRAPEAQVCFQLISLTFSEQISYSKLSSTSRTFVIIVIYCKSG